MNSTTVYKISDKGIEDLQAVMFDVKQIQKMGIVVDEKNNHSLLIEYKSFFVGEKGELLTEMKTINIK